MQGVPTLSALRQAATVLEPPPHRFLCKFASLFEANITFRDDDNDADDDDQA